MKLLLPFTLLVAAGVSAQDKGCKADYIVTSCLGSESKKAQACETTDYDCLCAAYQAIATCYNNCPNDPRAAPAQGQVGSYCQNASLYGKKAMASKTASMASPSGSSAAADATGSDASDSSSAATTTRAAIGATSTSSSSSSRSSSTGAAQPLAANAGPLFMAVAGAVAALL